MYEYKLVSYTYFMDEMQYYEVPLMFENIHMPTKQDWLMTRYMMWSALAPHMKESKDPRELMPLAFEVEEEEKKRKEREKRAPKPEQIWAWLDSVNKKDQDTK